MWTRSSGPWRSWPVLRRRESGGHLAPRSFEIERKLKEQCDIPIFHDDQHGTAVITLAGLLNALKVVGKKIEDVKIVTSGAGAAGIAIIKLLMSMGLKNVIMTDRTGAIYEGREGLTR